MSTDNDLTMYSADDLEDFAESLLGRVTDCERQAERARSNVRRAYWVRSRDVALADLAAVRAEQQRR